MHSLHHQRITSKQVILALQNIYSSLSFLLQNIVKLCWFFLHLFCLENHGRDQIVGLGAGGEEEPRGPHHREGPQGSLQAGRHGQEWIHLQDCKPLPF